MKIVLAIDPAQPRAAYSGALVAGGARPEEVLVVQPGDALPDEFDGLLVSGGDDVGPERYGETPVNRTVRPNPGRDALDFALVARAAQVGAAVFGICRGLQVLNVALGGTLWQDLPSQRPRGVAHSFSTRDGHDPARPAHAVNASRAASRALPFAATLASADGVLVNSRHHQAVKDLAPGLVPLAASPDDLVEAFAREEAPFFAAVQWHPENLLGREEQKALFAEFLAAARRRAAQRAGNGPRVLPRTPAVAEPPARSGGADPRDEPKTDAIAPSGAAERDARAARSAPRAGGEPEHS